MGKVNEATRDCFNAVIRMRGLVTNDTVDLNDLNTEMRREVEQMQSRAQKLGIAQRDAQDMAYAIVALIDEVALQASDRVSRFWVGHLLQMHFFQENVAGEEFFRYLDVCRVEQRVASLRVYYVCLLMGFSGRYGTAADAELGDIIASVKYDLQRAGDFGGVATLSPSGARPLEAITAPKRRLSLLWVPIVAVVSAAALYVGLGASLSRHATEVANSLGVLLK